MNLLDLSFNQLITLSDGVFNGLSRLNFLDLSFNRLFSTISDGVFSGLNQLNYLDLSYNRLNTLSDGVFSELSQLNYLDFWDNQLSTLSDGVFSELSQLNYLNLNSNQLSVLSEGIFSRLSQLNSLSLGGNRLSTLSEGVFSRLNQLNYLELGVNQLSTLSEGVFSRLSQLNYLSLTSNHLNDTAVKNLTQNFPFQLNELRLDSNPIGNDGALALAELLPCTNLSRISFSGNPANDTSIALAAQQKALRKVCEDWLCHANLPASQSCNVSQAGSGFSMMSWGREGSIEVTDENSIADMKSSTASYFYGFFAPHSFTHSTLPALPSPDFYLTKDSLITKGAMVAGVVGFGLLLYKNATMVKTVVNAGCRLLESCFDKTRDNLKTATNFYFFHSPLRTTTRTAPQTDSHPTATHSYH